MLLQQFNSERLFVETRTSGLVFSRNRFTFVKRHGVELQEFGTAVLDDNFNGLLCVGIGLGPLVNNGSGFLQLEIAFGRINVVNRQTAGFVGYSLVTQTETHGRLTGTQLL